MISTNQTIDTSEIIFKNLVFLIGDIAIDRPKILVPYDIGNIHIVNKKQYKMPVDIDI